MRSTQTFILRLLVDTRDAKQLRGSIRSVIDGEERLFSSDTTLLSLLHALVDTCDIASISNAMGISPDGEIDGLQEM
jgi:hypothetical protein